MVVYKGENEEYCDKVIKKILENWDELVNNKQNNILKSKMEFVKKE